MTENTRDKSVQNAQELEDIAANANIASEEVDVDEDVSSKSLDELLRSPENIDKLAAQHEMVEAVNDDEVEESAEESGQQSKTPAKIPYQRFAEKNNEARQKEERIKQLEEELREKEEEARLLLEERAYFAGKADAVAESKKAMPSPETDELAQVESKLKDLKIALDKKLEEIDQKYDDGDLTAKEWRKAERAYRDNAEKIKSSLEARRHSIVEERNRPTDEQIRESIENDGRIQFETQKMKSDNPWMDNVPQEIWDELAEDAALALARKGVKLGQDSNSVILVRKEMVNKAKRLKYDTIYAGDEQVDNPQPAINENLKNKLKLSQQQPPFPTMAGQKLPVDTKMAMRQQIAKNPNSYKADDLTKLSDEELIAVLDAAGQNG